MEGRIFASCIAASATSIDPSLRKADKDITLHPNSFSSPFKSISSPFFLTKSIILMAKTIGISNSNNCVVKYKLRSILVPSTILINASGRSFTRYCRATTSSILYGDNE